MGAGDLLVRTGAIVFIVGAVGTVATVAPLLLHTRRLPTPAYFVSMLMGVGFAIALVGLLRTAMAQRTPPESGDGTDGGDSAASWDSGDGSVGSSAPTASAPTAAAPAVPTVPAAIDPAAADTVQAAAEL